MPDVTAPSPAGACDDYCIDIGRGRIDGLVVTDTGPSANVIQVVRSIRLGNASMSGSPGQVGIAATSIRIANSVVTVWAGRDGP